MKSLRSMVSTAAMVVLAATLSTTVSAQDAADAGNTTQSVPAVTTGTNSTGTVNVGTNATIAETNVTTTAETNATTTAGTNATITTAGGPQALLDVLRANQLGVLADALSTGQEALLETLLADTDGFTVFAPTDEVLQRTLQELGSRVNVTEVLAYHVSPDVFNVTTIAVGDEEDEDGLVLPAVVETALTVPNLTGPQVLIAMGSSSSNTTATQTSDTNSTSSSPVITLKSGAPQPATVLNTIEANGTLIHVIDAVLLPPLSPAQVLAANGLTSLAQALEDESLLETVMNATNITIFAPTNEAFEVFAANMTAAASNTTAADSDANSDEEEDSDTEAGSTNSTASAVNITDTLLYHIVPQVLYSPAITANATLRPLQNGTLGVEVISSTNGTAIRLQDGRGGPRVNVTEADLLTNSGVIHVIDAVLLATDDVVQPDSASSLKIGLASLLVLLFLF